MNFLEFFSNLKAQKLSARSKEQIFQRVQMKKRQELNINKVNRFARVGVLGLLVLGVSAVTYFARFDGQNVQWAFNDGYVEIIEEENAILPVAFANEIGQIITAVGDINITNNGVVNSGSQLTHADKVLLLAGAELTFEMQGGVQAKIVGPAEFDLEKQGEKYVINMTEGEFVEIRSVVVEEVEQVITDRVFVEDEPAPEPKTEIKKPVQIIVKTPEFEVASDSTDGDIDIVIQEKDGKQVVENTGSDAVITKVIKDEVVVTELKSQEKADINGEVLIASITPDLEINEDQAEELAQNIKNNDLTISYTIDEDPEVELSIEEVVEETPIEEVTPPVLAQNPTPAPSVEPVAAAPVAEVQPAIEEPVEEIEEIAEEPVIEGKRVIGGADLASLQSSTNTSVLLRDIRNIVTNHAHGNSSGIQISLANIASNLSPVTQGVLGGMILNTSSPQTLQGSIQAMIDNLELKRYVPPVYVNRLKSTIAWLRLMETIPSGSVEASCDFDCIVSDVLQIQPSQKSRLMLP